MWCSRSTIIGFLLGLGLSLAGVLLHSQGAGYTNGTILSVVTSLPATCNVGEIVSRTSGTIAVYSCTATNTWTALGGGGGLPAGLAYASDILTLGLPGAPTAN